jgi:hypothetical protein
VTPVSPSSAKRLKAATDDSYVCPFCSFTAGVRLPSATGTDVVWVVRCVSCGKTSPFALSAGENDTHSRRP